VMLQHLDASLSDDAGGAENTNGNFWVHRVLGNFITSDADGREFAGG
jgi:hypothetical protein